MNALSGKFSTVPTPWMTALLGFLTLPTPAAEADFELSLDIHTHAAAYELQWDTRQGYDYELQTSTDLSRWCPTGLLVTGDGSRARHSIPRNAPRRFYRLRETATPFGENFLLKPEPSADLDLIDGVCFSFDLDVFEELPAKIHLYQRPDVAGADWEIIGTLTDFDEVNGLRFVSGSAVWIPETPGHYEIQASVVDPHGLILATAARCLVVGRNETPSITITGGPPSPSSTPQTPTFLTEVSDPEDVITHVEFFDHGNLLGTDKTPPYGDQLLTPSGRRLSLLRGLHEITARAHDVRGAVGITAEPYLVEITEGNARPVLTLASPESWSSVELGQSFTIHYDLTDPDGPEDLFRVEAFNLTNMAEFFSGIPPTGSLTIDTTGWQPGSHSLHVIGIDRQGASSYPCRIEVYVGSPGHTVGFARELALQITDPLSAPTSNEVFRGVEAAAAVFSDGLAAGMQIDSGTILTSGLAELWNFGDRYEGATESLIPEFTNHREPGSPLIERHVAGLPTFDAATLEFDVFSPGGQLEITYQFGSEEYDEWVDIFNDAFLITIDDVVVSLLPDCSDIVGVGSVNPITPANEHLYLDDDADILPGVLPENHSTRVEYDGMIRKLRASAFVTPNRTHRVRLVIADVNDDQLDSAIMVGSVRSLPASR